MHLTTDAIVLRAFKTQEDRILTLLTKESGVITAYANGANKLRSKLASSTELLCFSEFVLFENRDRHVVDKSDVHRVFFGIRSDVDKLALASYFAQLTAELAPHGEEAGEYLRLLLNTLHYLENGDRDRRLLKSLYELRLLTMAGYMPSLVGCRACGRFEVDPMYFFAAEGELCCGDCAGGQAPPGAHPLPVGVLTAMRHITYAPFDKLFSFRLSSEGLDLIQKIAEQYLLYQTEKSFTALEFYRELRD